MLDSDAHESASNLPFYQLKIEIRMITILSCKLTPDRSHLGHAIVDKLWRSRNWVYICHRFSLEDFPLQLAFDHFSCIKTIDPLLLNHHGLAF